MKKRLILFVFLGFTVNNLNAQKLKSSQDSIRVFYDKLFSVMEKGYLYKDKVEWSELRTKVVKDLPQYPDFKSSLKEVATIFDFAAADHCSVKYKDVSYTGNFPGPTAKDFSEQWLGKYKTKPNFEVKVLDDQFGYILMPEIIMDDFSSKNTHSIAQPMYDSINKIKNSHQLKGWIIDLRFNTGGNCVPMLLGLYDFLGDNDIWATINLEKEVISKITLSKGKYISGSKKISYINPKGILLDTAKVAVLTNIATGSSGEVTALAFKGRANTIFIGEKTNGKTTTNRVADLAFGAYISITGGYDADRTGTFYEQIIPDITITNQDNFDDLLLDGNVQEAIKFITDKE
ncbi:S41 family peptidase [Flavobacterium ardleyense]|uniref:S41 family peptidase n=1 Tax=Flavobacterium ardleyense TaxID=2038737 RepID=A0ABW5Z4Y1_9FLAO